MRKVKFNRFIERAYMDNSNTPIQGTGVWQEDYPNEGVFLDWGVFEGSTVALIELEDGNVEMVNPGTIKFESKESSQEQELTKANEQARHLVDKFGITGARTTCLQEMRDTSNSEHYKFWCRVNDLIPTR